jgi:hypothetical protein
MSVGVLYKCPVANKLANDNVMEQIHVVINPINSYQVYRFNVQGSHPTKLVCTRLDIIPVQIRDETILEPPPYRCELWQVQKGKTVKARN